MSRINKLSGRFSLALLLLLCGPGPAALGQSQRYLGHKEFLPYTRHLPAIDKVELLKLKLINQEANGVIDEQWNGEIEATKVMTGVEAQKVASLWRAQTYNQSLSACHEPAYAVKFYAKGKLIVYASVCWACNNISFITPKSTRTQNFLGEDKWGDQLYNTFRLAFDAR